MTSYADDMNHTCTVWTRTGLTMTGESEYAGPVRHACRWQHKNVLFVDAQGQQRVSAAVIYIDTTTVTPGDRIAFGEHYAADPVGSGASVVSSVNTSPDLEDDETLTTVFI